MHAPRSAGEHFERLAGVHPVSTHDGLHHAARRPQLCIERELLSWRRLRFPSGVAIGDIVVFPNTAGYLMHILESSSHQIPLARNLVVSTARGPVLDAIDR